MKKNKENVIVYILLIIFAIIMMFPFYWMLISSFKTSSEIVHRPPTIFPENFTLENYKYIFDNVNIGKYFFNSIVVVVLCLITSLYTTIAGAFALSKLNLPGKNIILGILISLMMVPYELLVVTNYTTIVQLKLNDNLFALVLPFMSSIFYTLLLKNYFDKIPTSLYYSVLIDGGNEWKYLWKVLIPSSKPILFSIALFNAVASWNSFMWPLLIIKSKENRTVTFGIYAFITEGGEQFELMMALSVIVIIPMVVVFIIMRKYFVQGISLSGNKG